MKINLVAPVGIAAIVVGMAGVSAGPASAANNIKPFGQQETLNDIGYTVKRLTPSSDPIPHSGQLYVAVVKAESLAGGWATPMTVFFNARAESGQSYRIVGGGVAPAPPGGHTTGKIYFDVVGDVPNSVVYNDGVQDLMVWVPGAPIGGVPTDTSDDAPGEVTEIASLPAEQGSTGGDKATPDVVAPGAPNLTEGEVASPGWNNFISGGRRG